MPAIDPYSVSTVPLEMFFNDTYLSLGTGFVWRMENDLFLITNWHNLSGKNPFTGMHLSNTLAEPNSIRVWWNLRDQLGNKIAVSHPIHDNEGRPLWWIHPQHGRKIDVVALPVFPTDQVAPYPIIDMENVDLRVEVGMDLFVLGYPYGIAQGGLPIWKRASFATEPEMAGAGEDLHMLLDTASRPGLSGSPVIRRTWGAAPMTDGSIAMFAGGSATKFVGVYSGRIHAQDPLDAQLGIAWPAALVTEIVSGGRRDDP